MRITELEAEMEMMMLAFSITDEVLREDENEELRVLAERQRQQQIQQQEELDLELALALSDFDHNDPGDLQNYTVYSGHREQYTTVWLDALSAIHLTIPDLYISHEYLPNGQGMTHTITYIDMELIPGNQFAGQQSSILMCDFMPESPYYGLDPMYFNYRYVPIKFSEEHQWPPAAVSNQLLELSIDRGNEDVVEWQEGMSENDRCLICLTNVATRLAVPCGHKQSCRYCIDRIITPARSEYEYLVITPDGGYVPTRFQVPVRCVLCRCIIGMIIVCR